MYILTDRWMDGLGQASSTIDLDRAVRLNAQYAKSLPWLEQMSAIMRLVGFAPRPFVSPYENLKGFAEAVARWQQSQGLSPADGIIGPKTWKRMQDAIGTKHTSKTPTVVSSSPSATKGMTTGPCVFSSDRSCIRCGSCEACERRIRAANPAQLVPVPLEIVYGGKKKIQLDKQALAAYQKLYQQARAAGIPEPYLKISSGHRDYDVQAGLWKGRLLRKFEKLGCSGTSLKCVASAIDRATQTLKARPIPHPKGTWRKQFLQDLSQAGCSISCDPNSAVQAMGGTAPPGSSPHHTGRAVDVYVGRAPGADSSASTTEKHVDWQRQQPSYQWLVCNSARFGFYPLNNSRPKGEPWHWEYNPT